MKFRLLIILFSFWIGLPLIGQSAGNNYGTFAGKIEMTGPFTKIDPSKAELVVETNEIIVKTTAPDKIDISFHLKFYSLDKETDYKYNFEWKGKYTGLINQDKSFSISGTMEGGLEEWGTKKWKTTTVNSISNGKISNKVISGDFKNYDPEDPSILKPSYFSYNISTDDITVQGNNELGGTIPGWTIIVGSIAASAAIVAAVARAMKARKANKPDQKNDKKEQPKQYHYILNLNKEEFLLEPGNSQVLVATVYRVDENGVSSQAPGAFIQIGCNEPLLLVNPSQGTTTVSSSLNLTGISAKTTIDLVVRVKTEDNKLIEQPVRINTGLKLLANSEFPREIISGSPYFEVYCRQQAGSKKGEWEFKPLYLFFASAATDIAEPKPVAPPFSPAFSFKVQPDILSVGQPVYQGNLVWKTTLNLKPGFSPDIGWLMDNGKINIETTAHQL